MFDGKTIITTLDECVLLCGEATDTAGHEPCYHEADTMMMADCWLAINNQPSKYHNYFFLENKIITSFQSGFLPGFSTKTQLVELQYCFTKALDDQKDTRIVFHDISKAFDRV